MTKFFNITAPYRFEWNDLRAGVMLLNVLFVILFGFSASWFGLFVAVFGIVKDLSDKDRRVNGLMMHIAGVVLNCYFLHLMYAG